MTLKNTINFFTCNTFILLFKIGILTRKNLVDLDLIKHTFWSIFSCFHERHLKCINTHLISCSNSINFSISLLSTFSNLAFWDGAVLKNKVTFICLIIMNAMHTNINNTQIKKHDAMENVFTSLTHHLIAK